jgi:hypothetical protein
MKRGQKRAVWKIPKKRIVNPAVARPQSRPVFLSPTKPLPHVPPVTVKGVWPVAKESDEGGMKVAGGGRERGARGWQWRGSGGEGGMVRRVGRRRTVLDNLRLSLPGPDTCGVR